MSTNSEEATSSIGHPGSAASSRKDSRNESQRGSTAHSLPGPRQIRSLPAWIASYGEDDDICEQHNDQPTYRLLQSPAATVTPHHNHAPSDLHRRISHDGYVAWEPPSPEPAPGFLFRKRKKALARGRKWDSLRSAEPVIVSNHRPQLSFSGKTEAAPTWFDFVQASSYGRSLHECSEVVDIEVLNKLQPTFNQDTALPPHFSNPRRASRRRRTMALYKRIWFAMMRNSLVPLLLRLLVLASSIAVLAIACRIFILTKQIAGPTRSSRSQSIMAIVVDTLAVPYIGYMLWDEYTGKPLGLRSPFQKITLILLDLFFIIFKSASTALAFEYLDSHVNDPNGDGVPDGNVQVLVRLTKVLAAFMLVGLISWTLTFVVNIFRTVERLAERSPDEDL